MSKENEDDFSVTIATDIKEENTVVVTTTEKAEQWMAEAMQKYDPSNRQYSTYLNDMSLRTFINQEVLDNLARNPQDDLNKIKQINSIIKYYINSDDIIGKVSDVIETNVNTEYRLSYNDFSSQRNKGKTLDKVKTLIGNFNESICIENIIRSSIPTTYTEGTVIMYLRHENGDYKIDFYPLGVAFISNYSIGVDPCVLIDINELVSRLSKNYPKTKKKSALFFEDIDQEIKANYPIEIYDAYKNREQYAKLDIKYSYVMRTGNMNGKYGLSPIFRALSDVIMLNTFRDADETTSKSRSKKIIGQFLNKEMAGSEYSKDCFDLAAWCHENFMAGWKQKTVVVTAPPAVRDIKYIESKTELTDVKVVTEYRSKVYNTLGIGFLIEGTSSVSTANISVSQLLKTINKISQQLEIGLKKFYKQILVDNGYDLEYCPKINIIDSEQLEMSIKKDLATTLYTTFNTSLQTSLELLGIDMNDEIARRKEENDAGYDKIFTARQTAYNTSGTPASNSKGGNPRDSSNTDKEAYDEEYNKINRNGGGE